MMRVKNSNNFIIERGFKSFLSHCAQPHHGYLRANKIAYGKNTKQTLVTRFSKMTPSLVNTEHDSQDNTADMKDNISLNLQQEKRDS